MEHVLVHLGLLPLCTHHLLCFVPVNDSTQLPFLISSLFAATSWEAPPGVLRWLGLGGLLSPLLFQVSKFKFLHFPCQPWGSRQLPTVASPWDLPEL